MSLSASGVVMATLFARKAHRIV